MNPIILDNGNLRLSFNPQNGALCGLSAPQMNWDILDRAELGLSYRLLVPINDELRNNPVHGEEQQLSFYELSNDGKHLTLVWDGVTSKHTGKIDIKITLHVVLEGQEAVYYMDIANHTPYQVESVYCPYLGDTKHPEKSKWFKMFFYSYASATEWELWPHFYNLKGYYGVDYPTQFATNAVSGTNPASPFTLIRNENMGLYCGVKANSSELVAWHSELRPGWDSSIDARVPEVMEISGKPVHTRFAAVHMPYILPGETRSLTPIALSAYQGGWQQGTDIYKAWRKSWMKAFSPPAWAAEPHAWQQLHINSPEDELRLRFIDLPKVAEECVRYGVKAIQLVGWNNGGQDQGNPTHDFDPRMGTYEELKSAIAACQRLGVKIVLFSKFVWADRGTAWFRDKLIEYAIKDPYGDYYMHPGYQYQTPAQLLDINTKRLVPMCFLSEEYRKICQTEFLKLVELGADGMLFDECLHHTPAWVCFDLGHGHRYGAPVFQNDRLLIEEFRKLPGVPQDFLMAGEACYDWEMEQYQLSYHRSEHKQHIPLSRYMLPEAQFMTAVTGFNDRNMINQCLMMRYIISYEPYNFKGRLSDYPETMAYGLKMDMLRTELRKWLWDGEFRDTCGASVTHLNGEAHSTYSVFEAADGTKAIVIVNYEDHPVTVRVDLQGSSISKYRLVDCDQWMAADVMEIPGRSAAVAL